MAQVTLQIALPTARIAPGSQALATGDLVSLRLLRTADTSPGTEVATLDISAKAPGDTVSITDPDAPTANYGYSATVIDKDKRESVASDLFPVVVAAPLGAPLPPTILSATQA